MVHLVEGVLTVTMIVGVVVTAAMEEVAAMTTAIVARATTTATAVLMADVTIMDPVELIAMPRAVVMIAIAAAVTIVVAVANTTAATEDVLVTVAMPILRLQETLEIPTEVDPSMTALTIGTLVIKLRLANLFRCGALCEIKAPTPASTTRL